MRRHTNRWRRYAGVAEPRTDVVHVWCVRLEGGRDQVERLWRLLSPDEQQRADAFRFARLRTEYVIARGVLRLILGQCLGIDPSEVAFDYGPQGKPRLAAANGNGGHGGPALHFNLAHSRQLALIAVALGRELGIDVEHLEREVDNEGIARRFFSPREAALLNQLPPARRREGFFSCWTRKEAFIKALGQGLSLPLDQFDVSVAPGEPAALLAVRWNPHEVHRWRLEALRPPGSYIAALAVEGKDWDLECWRWSGNI